MIRKIWTCWFQGEDDPGMPELNRICKKRWIEFNDQWDYTVITNDNIAEYIPEYCAMMHSYGHEFHRSYTNKADVLRLFLLQKYGGVWADTSVYPMMPLDDFYDEIVNETGFFTYRFFPRSIKKKLGDREAISWLFITREPDNYLISRTKDKLVKRYLAKDAYKYFSLSEAMCELYDSDEKAKHIIDNMVQISEQIPHSALKSWKLREPSYMYKRPSLV
jgi:hypothetical protein